MTTQENGLSFCQPCCNWFGWRMISSSNELCSFSTMSPSRWPQSDWLVIGERSKTLLQKCIAMSWPCGITFASYCPSRSVTICKSDVLHKNLSSAYRLIFPVDL